VVGRGCGEPACAALAEIPVAGSVGNVIVSGGRLCVSSQGFGPTPFPSRVTAFRLPA
jgi:hypothetical protein